MEIKSETNYVRNWQVKNGHKIEDNEGIFNCRAF